MAKRAPKLSHAEQSLADRNAKALADRVARARRANPPRDPTGRYHAALCELARTVGREPADLLDDWDHRAACREYEGDVSRDEAERLAMDDVEQMYAARQERMAV